MNKFLPLIFLAFISLSAWFLASGSIKAQNKFSTEDRLERNEIVLNAVIQYLSNLQEVGNLPTAQVLEKKLAKKHRATTPAK